MYRIGNLRALCDALIEQAERDGNEAEHYLGIELVNLARKEGMTEDQIIEAIAGEREKREADMSLRPRPGESAEDVLARVVKAAQGA